MWALKSLHDIFPKHTLHTKGRGEPSYSSFSLKLSTSKCDKSCIEFNSQSMSLLISGNPAERHGVIISYFSKDF